LSLAGSNTHKNLDSPKGAWYLIAANDGVFLVASVIDFGAIAQLGERLNGIQEVGGSRPPSSTIYTKILAGRASSVFFDKVYLCRF
jgi:hypothetical protein